MRQLLGFLKIIDKANATNHYMKMSAYASAAGNKINISLEEYLGLALKQEVKAFDDGLDSKLEAHMKKITEQKKNG